MLLFFFFISSSPFDPAVIPQIDLLQAETYLGMGLLAHAAVARGGKQAAEAQISCQKMRLLHNVVLSLSLENARRRRCG